MPANFVIPFPFISELRKDLVVQGSICFKGRLFSTMKPRRLCSPLPVGELHREEVRRRRGLTVNPPSLAALGGDAARRLPPAPAAVAGQGQPEQLPWLPRGWPARLCSEFLYPSPSQVFPAATGTRHREQTEQGRARNLGDSV